MVTMVKCLKLKLSDLSHLIQCIVCLHLLVFLCCEAVHSETSSIGFSTCTDVTLEAKNWFLDQELDGSCKWALI